ncbi:MAG: nicotinate-nucleotide adenylyltransferase [Christensenellales bacterium]|jgi:nicotinate-nucleotide adenylyltransferase
MGIGCDACLRGCEVQAGVERRRRVGLLGGTFNPVHVGHVALGMQAKKEFSLDGVVYVPVGLPPHKRDEFVADAQDRFAMLQLAVGGQPGLSISRIEMDRQGYTYTVDTLTDLKCLYPDDDFYFIIGADTLFEVQTWKNVARVFELCGFIVFYRPGHHAVAMMEEVGRLREAYGARMQFAEFTGPDVSSTLIRHKLERGESVEGMLPPGVERYILENGVYG